MSIEPFEQHSPHLEAGAWVHERATVIGAVRLGACVSVWPGAVVRGDVNSIAIGADSNVQDLACLHVTHRRPEDPQGAPLLIGARVTIGHGALLHGCTVGDECLIGMGALVLDRAVIEPRVMLGAGSLVPPGKTLASGWLYVGRPAQAVRPLTPAEIDHLAYSAAHYVRLMQRYRASAQAAPMP